jgi:hypothetical protein
MFIQRLITTLLAVLVLTTFSTHPAAAKGPRPGPASPADELPLTPAEIAASDAKVAAAEAYLASTTPDDAGLSTLACVYPDSVSSSGEETGDEAITATCTTPSYVLGVVARDQNRAHWCGPAVGQVISNYSWGKSGGYNKYAQRTIAGWMSTDTYGSTNAHRLEYGLERATSGAPRRPANWDWVISYLKDTDGDGQFGDQLHDYVRANVSGSKMPLAIPVKPHARDSRYHLSSWPRPVNSVGHWIAGYGWYAYWTNSDTPHIAYTDSSKDEGGSTGKFWDPTRHLAAMILEHTGRFVW